MKKKKIGIINLEVNNIHSIYEACIAAGFKVRLISDKERSYNYDVVILPGIGSFKTAMNKISNMNFKDKIIEFLENKNNLLVGICLGMQLFFTKSTEFGNTHGLDLIEGKVGKINKNLIVPHTGWNKIKLINNNQIFDKKFDKEMFYFTHSFYCSPKQKKEIIGKTKYFNLDFCSIVQKKNIFGMQFHPEKSGKSGLRLLKNIQRY